MARRVIAIFLLLAFLPAFALADTDWWRKYVKNTDLSVTGSKTFAYRSHRVSGSEQAFEDDNLGLSSQVLDETNLTVTGKLFENLNINATLIDNRWNPSETIVSLGYEGRHLRADLGDINASLTGNALMPFSRRIRGLMLTQKVGSASVTGLVSQTKAATKSVKMRGNNTPGPYYLGASRIIDGSERVLVDDRQISRTNSDGTSNYTLDSFSGILQFRDSMIISSGSTIVVSFESQGYNNVAGTLWGMRSSVPITDNLNLGLTYLTQASGQQSQLELRKDEPQYGKGTPEAQYWLDYMPISVVSVKVDGIPLGFDQFTVSTELPYIIIKPIVAPSQIVTVTYYTKPDETVSGNRSVMGFDSTLKVSNNITIAGQYAKSNVGADGTGSGGDAVNLTANANLNKVTLAIGLKNTDPNFASVDTTGFRYNEKGGNFSMQYKPTDKMAFNTAYNKYRRSNSYSSGTEASLVRFTDYTNWTNNLAITLPRWPTINISRTYLSNYGDPLPQTGSTVDTYREANSQTTDAIDLRWSNSSGRISLGTGFARNNYNNESRPEWSSNSNTSRFNAQYLPGEKLSLALDLSNSKVKDGTGSSYDAKNSSLTANYLPTSSLSFSGSYRITDSGRITPYYTDISAGSDNMVTVASYGGKATTKMVGMRFSPSVKYALDVNLNQTSTEGDNTTNTSTTGQDFGLTIAPWNWLQFMGHMSFQDMGYIGETGNVGTNIGFFRLQLGPIKEFSLDLNFQDMTSGGFISGSLSPGTDSNYDFNMKTFTAELRRSIGHSRTAFLQYQNSDSFGIETRNKRITALGINFPLNKILGITCDWRVTDSTDSKYASNNYKANSFNVELGARFR